MKILIVSDTHGRNDNLVRVLEREGPISGLIHCGDVEGEEDTIREMADCPVYMVSGNNDYFSDLPDEIEIELGGCRMFISHGHMYGVYLDLKKIWEEGYSRDVQVIAFGHIHRPVLKEIRGITLVNPGSLSYPRQSGRKYTYIVMDVRRGERPVFDLREV